MVVLGLLVHWLFTTVYLTEEKSLNSMTTDMDIWPSVPICTLGIVSLEYTIIPYSLGLRHLAKSSIFL